MSDEPVKVCPKCKRRKVEKLISHTSFQLRGGGWYSDLYASQKPGSSSEPKSDKPESASSSKSESKSESATGAASPKASASKSSGKKGVSKAAA